MIEWRERETHWRWYGWLTIYPLGWVLGIVSDCREWWKERRKWTN